MRSGRTSPIHPLITEPDHEVRHCIRRCGGLFGRRSQGGQEDEAAQRKRSATGALARGHEVGALYREAHQLIEDTQEARELGAIRKLPAGAADELADVLMSRHEKASTLITSNRGFNDCAEPLGDVVIVAQLIDRLMHHGHLLKFDGKS